MDFNQEKIDKIRGLLPLCMRKKVFNNINKGKTGAAVIPYSTICDVLKVYREGGRPRYRKRRLKIYNESVKLLNEKGITIE